MRRLYHLWLSPFSRKVRIVLAEKGLEFEMKVEKTWERRPEFLGMNPAGQLYIASRVEHPHPESEASVNPAK